jgi:hypothetical protein
VRVAVVPLERAGGKDSSMEAATNNQRTASERAVRNCSQLSTTSTSLFKLLSKLIFLCLIIHFIKKIKK